VSGQINKNSRFSVSRFCALGWVVLLASLSAESAETIIRCRLSDGRVSFSDRPCSAGIQDELEFEDQKVGWEAPRTPLKLKHKSRREKQKQARRKAAALQRAKKKKARKKRDCWKKKQKIDRIQEHLRRGYKAGQGRTMRYRQRELEDYLREFCR